MKKTLLLLVALITATIAFAQTEINGIYYNLNDETQTAEVTSNSNKYSGDITIPEKVTYNATEYSVTSIGSSAFRNCSSLTSVTIPNSVTSIGEWAFSDCSSLTSITIPNSVTSIGNSAFYNCSSLTSITIPNSVTSIGNSVFYNCAQLTSITIPNSVNSIGSSAFNSCSSLTSITIPNSVTSIGSVAFSSCSNIAEIHISDIAKWCDIDFKTTESNPLYNKNACLYVSGNKITELVIPEGVDSIKKYAFYNYAQLTSVTIPNSVTSIGNSVFYNCSSLTSIIIPNSVTSIGSSTFYNCSSLDSITCLGSTPPSANNLRAQYETCILFVPKGSLNDYQNHAEWSKFSNIQELEGEKYTITTAVNDESMGYVIGEGEYEKDSEITLTATANSGYSFVQWSDGNIENPRTITVTQDSTFTAEFILEEFALYATSASPELGYVEHIIRAVAIEGFEFDGWSDGNTENPRTIVLTEDTKLYAYFRMAQGGTPVDLETSKISSANIYTTNGTLHVENATENYHILDAAGRLIYSGNATTLTLPRGIYLVTMGGEVEKIVL